MNVLSVPLTQGELIYLESRLQSEIEKMPVTFDNRERDILMGLRSKIKGYVVGVSHA